MAGLRSVMIISMLMVLVLAVVGHKKERLHARQDSGYQQPCTDDPAWYQYRPPCSTTSTSTSTTTESTTASTDTMADTPLSRQYNNWCRSANGTYLPRGYTYQNTPCSICQCLPARVIRCQPLDCMPTYCADNSMPSRRTGQCCTQCAYDSTPNACTYNNLTYPHGTVIKSIEGKMQCWCQLGNIECRNYMGSLFDGLDMGTTIYMIIIILVVVLIFGFLLCCGCTLGCYYYFRQHQQTIQQAYDEYINSAGWQPMDENAEYAADPNAEEKSLEAEKSQFENSVVEVVPPPYAGYNRSYVAEEK